MTEAVQLDSPALRPLAEADRGAYFRGVHPLWGGGLELPLFDLYQQRLVRAPESERRYELAGLYVDGRPVSAMKIYRLAARLEGTPLELRGIGAVFTPPSERRQGFAHQMLSIALRRFASEGVDGALLFSDIGARYYERLGFRAMESLDCTLDASLLPRGKGARPASPGDEAAMSSMLARHRGQAAGLWLERDDGWALRFQLRRLRELARTRNVGEPDWGLVVEGKGRQPAGAAMIRYTKDGIDVLDAAWDTGAARDALLGALRERLLRLRQSALRVWPSHQFRGLFPATARTNAVAMLAPLSSRAESAGLATRAELTLLDHI